MEAYTLILWAHITSGFTALLVGLLPMVTEKGSKEHIISGRVYFYAMLGVFLTSTMMFAIKPHKLLFLFLIGVFSFYNTLSGVRYLAYKKQHTAVKQLDWVSSSVVFSAGLSMVVLGLYNFYTGSMGQGVLYLVFGGICTLQAGKDLHFFMQLNKGIDPGKTWLVQHVARMGGSYIATFTAFNVVNNFFLPSLVAWLGPGVVGGIIISRVVSKLQLK